MDVAMDSNNGLLNLPPEPASDSLSPQLPAKRKREDSSKDFLSNGNTTKNGTPSLSPSLQDMVADLLQVLQSQDTHAILSRPIEPRDDEPQAKRQRAESEFASPHNLSTIRARAASGEYKSLDELVLDINRAADAVSMDLQLPQGSFSNLPLSVPKREVDAMMDIELFRKNTRELVERQKAFNDRRGKGQPNGVVPKEKTMTNGIGSTSVTELVAKGDGKVVLTLFGNAATPRQLFSSLQESVHQTGLSQPLREVALPNGVTTTHIIPAKTLELTDEKKRIPTFGELFANSPNLSLPPPKPSKNAATRSNVVGWYNPLAIENNKPRSSSYFGQIISSGQWLEYNSISKSPGSKRKRRERALSLSGKPPPLEVDHEDDDSKQLESLFRSAFSSFAPNTDDSASVAPERTVNRIWWQNVGEKSYERFIRNSEQLSNLTNPDVGTKIMELDENEVNTDDPKDEFDTWVPSDAIDPSLQDAPKSILEKDVEEVLKEISELLETLNSYQRIRNLSLNQHSRPAGGLASTETLITPARPSENEQATYEILKSQLSIMISQLPPYAVAKLDSDQLSNLSISTRIPIETEDYKGVMEEDEFAARAKIVTMSAATTAPRVPTAYSNNRTPSTSSLYGNQYGTAAPTRSAAPSGYYNPTPIRQSSTSMGNMRGGPVSQQYSSQPQYNQRQVLNAGYRPAPTATPTYPHQNPRLGYQTNTPSGTYFQQTTQPQPHYGQAATNTYSGMSQTTPQALLNGRYATSTTHQNYPPRAAVAQNSINCQHNANLPRQNSPQKPPPPNMYNSPQPPLSQPQRNFNTPTPTDSRGYFQRTGSNGTPTTQSFQPRPPPGTTSTSSVVNYMSVGGYATVMSEAEQGTMMERNRRHLAQQQSSSQIAARTAAQPNIQGLSVGVTGQSDGSAMAALVEFNKS